MKKKSSMAYSGLEIEEGGHFINFYNVTCKYAFSALDSFRSLSKTRD